MPVARIVVRIAAVVVIAIATHSSTVAAGQDRQPPAPQTQTRSDDRWAKVGEWQAYQAALSVRRAAANGTGAPQIGLNPTWPNRDYGFWEKAQREHPKDAAKFEPCVAKFVEAIDIIKGIAPLTKRPAWDHSIDQINAALRQARALIREGDQCLEHPEDAEPRRPLLKGRVEYNEGNPPLPPPEPEPPATTTSAVPDMGAMLRGLAGAIDALAPHYDMTRPHEGVRIISDIVVNMGLGYLAKNVPGAVRAVMNKRRGGRVYGGSNGGGLAPSSAGSWGDPAGIPPGMQIPASVGAFPRPVFLQETANSCGAACVRMVQKTVTGSDLPENTLRNMLKNPLGPAELRELQPLLRAGGVRTQYLSNATAEEVVRATANGRPALVHVGAQGNGHYMVVDGLARDASGKPFVLLRDPTNLEIVEASSRDLLKAAGHTETPIVSFDDFKNMFSGAALIVAR